MRFLIQLGILVVVGMAFMLSIGLMSAWREGEILEGALIAVALAPALYGLRLLWRADDRQELADLASRQKAERTLYQGGDLVMGNSWLAYAGFMLVLAMGLPGALLLFASDGFFIGLLLCIVFWPPLGSYIYFWCKQIRRPRLRLG